MKKFNYLFISILCIFLFLFSSCQQNIQLTNYISEYRKAIYQASDDEISSTLRFSERESPNLLDGICANMENIVDIILFTKNYVQDCSISFELNGKTYGGDCSYDSALGCYTYMESVDCPNVDSFNVHVTLEKTEHILVAQSVVKEKLYTPQQVLSIVQTEKPEKIKPLCSDGVFLAEIRIRLLYDDGCFYYVGITDRNQNTYSILMNALTGEIIAEREG